MNIKNRLTKIERVTGDPTVCGCYPQRFETYTQDFGEGAANSEPVLTSDPIPEICPVCRKQTERNASS